MQKFYEHHIWNLPNSLSNGCLNGNCRAVLSVVEHFTKMRLQFSQFMSAFAALRFIRWAYARLRALAGLQSLPDHMTDVDGGVGGDVRDGRVALTKAVQALSFAFGGGYSKEESPPGTK